MTSGTDASSNVVPRRLSARPSSLSYSNSSRDFSLPPILTPGSLLLHSDNTRVDHSYSYYSTTPSHTTPQSAPAHACASLSTGDSSRRPPFTLLYQCWSGGESYIQKFPANQVMAAQASPIAGRHPHHQLQHRAQQPNGHGPAPPPPPPPQPQMTPSQILGQLNEDVWLSLGMFRQLSSS